MCVGGFAKDDSLPKEIAQFRIICRLKLVTYFEKNDRIFWVASSEEVAS